MRKSAKKHNILSIYIREAHKPLFEEFEELIKKDDTFKSQRFRNKSGLLSVALITLIYNYVIEKNPEFQLGDSEVIQQDNQ